MASNQHQEKGPAVAGPNTIPSRAAEAVMMDAIDTVAAFVFASSKPFLTLQARFALAGWELKVGVNGEISATRWGHGTKLTTLDEVEAFARRVGVTL